MRLSPEHTAWQVADGEQDDRAALPTRTHGRSDRRQTEAGTVNTQWRERAASS